MLDCEPYDSPHTGNLRVIVQGIGSRGLERIAEGAGSREQPEGEFTSVAGGGDIFESTLPQCPCTTGGLKRFTLFRRPC
jgi:hypothetical protein